jgi:hypothetical protein
MGAIHQIRVSGSDKIKVVVIDQNLATMIPSKEPPHQLDLDVFPENP